MGHSFAVASCVDTPVCGSGIHWFALDSCVVTPASGSGIGLIFVLHHPLVPFGTLWTTQSLCGENAWVGVKPITLVAELPDPSACFDKCGSVA